MRASFLLSLAMLPLIGAGCDWHPASWLPGRRAAAPEPARNQPGGGLSLHPLSAGDAGQPPAGDDLYGQTFAPAGQPQYQAEEPPRHPSPYDPLLRGRYQTSWPAATPVSPVYAVSSPVAAPAYSDGGVSYASGPSFPAPDAAPVSAGLKLIPAPDVPPGIHPGDAAPSQWFEIIRPDNGPLRIGRLSTTCVCIGARAPKRQVAAGERALIEVRTLTRPPRNDTVYGLYAGILEPEKTMLDVDVPVRH